jgi:hypothetical protein
MRRIKMVVGVVAVGGLIASCSSAQATLVNHPVGSSSVAHTGDTLALVTGGGHPFSLELTQVVDPAHATGNATPKHGRRFVATLFKFTNNSDAGIAGDSNADADIIGSDGQTYLPAHVSLTECSGTSGAAYHLASGKSGTSCVAYEVPTAVTVKKVQFYPAAGGASKYGEWLVP